MSTMYSTLKTRYVSWRALYRTFFQVHLFTLSAQGHSMTTGSLRADWSLTRKHFLTVSGPEDPEKHFRRYKNLPPRAD